MKFISLSILILLISSQAWAQTVCSEDELIREIREDIADNGLIFIFIAYILTDYNRKTGLP